MARILVIDDSPINLDLMTYLLRSFGHTPVGCSKANEGLAAVRAGGFQLVLCDILMPGIDGYDFARTLKGDPSLASIPLVAVTALAMSGDRERIAEAGFDGYIGKPIDPEGFVKLIESFLAGGP